MAFDKSDGGTLWEWQLDAPINAPVTTFEHRGEQVVAVYAGGSFYGGSKHGDGVWLLSRRGTMKPAAAWTDGAPGAAPALPAIANADGGNVADGRKVYQRICEPCHGETGKGGHAEGAVLPDDVTAQHVMTIATTGRKEMPSFAQALSDQERRDVAAYVERLLKK
jgi:mono/diheme cytochrome c family protein